MSKFEEKVGEDVAVLVRGMLNNQVSLTQIYENLLIGSDKFFLSQQSPKPENNRYSEKAQKRMSPGIEKQIQEFQDSQHQARPDEKDEEYEDKENQHEAEEADTKQGVQISQLVSQQFKKLWGQDFLEDSDQKVYVPFNPGDNYLNEQMTLGLGCNFNCSILEQQQMQLPIQLPAAEEKEEDEVMQDITNHNQDSVAKKQNPKG